MEDLSPSTHWSEIKELRDAVCSVLVYFDALWNAAVIRHREKDAWWNHSVQNKELWTFVFKMLNCTKPETHFYARRFNLVIDSIFFNCPPVSVYVRECVCVRMCVRVFVWSYCYNLYGVTQWRDDTQSRPLFPVWEELRVFIKIIVMIEAVMNCYSLLDHLIN